MRSKLIFATIVFASGGNLLGYELLSNKVLEPFFGSSLYVWAANIGSTMIGLAFGYFLSPLLIRKFSSRLLIFYISMGITILLVSQTTWIPVVLERLAVLNLRTGIICSTFFVNFPVFLLFGTITPLLIQVYPADKVGFKSGWIYGLSTLGGVCFLLLVGVYGLPILGLRITIILSSLMAMIIGFLGMFHPYFKLTEK